MFASMKRRCAFVKCVFAQYLVVAYLLASFSISVRQLSLDLCCGKRARLPPRKQWAAAGQHMSRSSFLPKWVAGEKYDICGKNVICEIFEESGEDVERVGRAGGEWGGQCGQVCCCLR